MLDLVQVGQAVTVAAVDVQAAGDSRLGQSLGIHVANLQEKKMRRNMKKKMRQKTDDF